MVTTPGPATQAEHNRQTRDAYDRLAAVWSATTDNGPFNGLLERQRLWRRPLSAVADAFADAGFVIDRIAEPQPSQEALEQFPSELAGIAGVPTFIVYRLRLAR